MQKDKEYQFTLYVRQTNDRWEGFVVEQHSGPMKYYGETEEGLLANIRNDLAETIANCMSVFSFFDFDENQKHEYPLNYRLSEKQDIRDFKQVKLVINEDDINPHRVDMTWLHGKDFVREI